MYFFQGPLWWLLSYWHWLVTLQVTNTRRVSESAQLQREPSSCRVSAAPWALQGMKVPGTQYPQEQQLHAGILSPLSSSCVSLKATGEEHWSFFQGYTEVSEVSAAVCWGEDAATRRQHWTQSVPGVLVSAHNLRVREALTSSWFPTLLSVLLGGQVPLNSTRSVGF